jgi:integrase
MARIRLTAGRIREFSCPSGSAQSFLWDSEAPGLAVRATPPGKRNPAGTKAYIFQGKLIGKDIRITIGDVRAWDIDSAQAEARRLSTLLDQGVDPRNDKAEKLDGLRRDADKATLTFAAALQEYVQLKRRAVDNLPLKERTKSDYLKMVAAAKTRSNGTVSAEGSLHILADRPIHTIGAEEIRSAYNLVLQRGERQAAYAMQVLRAVFNWHGIKVPSNPFSKDVAGRNRIIIPQAKSGGKPIPAERIGAWWKAVNQARSARSRDYFKFLVLTGMRVTEPKTVRVADCDLVSGRLVVRDTKNRKDHTVLLSRQAAEIVERNIDGKRPDDLLFTLADGKKTRETIIKRSGADFRAKDLRATFASIAAGLVTAYTLKRMMNHAGSGDVTGMHYVQLSDEDLRAGWQAVADYIESKAVDLGDPASVTNLAEVRQQKIRTAMGGK